MSYCTIEEALSLLPTIGALRDADEGPPAVSATVPSLTQATLMLAATEAEIDAHLADRRAALPVSAATALAYLRTVAMTGTAARIAKAKWPADSGAGGDAGAAAALRADYAAMLAFIDGGGLASVVGVSVEGATGAIGHGFGGGPQFTRDMEW